MRKDSGKRVGLIGFGSQPTSGVVIPLKYISTSLDGSLCWEDRHSSEKIFLKIQISLGK